MRYDATISTDAVLFDEIPQCLQLVGVQKIEQITTRNHTNYVHVFAIVVQSGSDPIELLRR